MILEIGGVIAAGCAAFVIYEFTKGSGNAPEGKGAIEESLSFEKDGRRRVVALEDLSPLWTRRKVKISLENLSKKWKEAAEQAREVSICFVNQDTQMFYDDLVEGNMYLSGEAYEFAVRLLKLLDEHGGCSSIATGSSSDSDQPYEKDRNSYEILSRVTLRAHSLSVAEEAMKRAIEMPLLISPALIAGLGHDIGKIPQYREKLYSLGDHPFISATALAGLEGYETLPGKDQISQAVRDHHRPSKEVLCHKLREADQEARKRELAKATGAMPVSAPVTMEPQVKPAAQRSYEEPQGQAAPEEKEAPAEGRGRSHDPEPTVGEQLYGEDEKQKAERPVEVELNWFDPNVFLDDLRPFVNRLDGGRFCAFSMPDGTVYFQTNTLWDIAKKIATSTGHPEILVGDADAELRRSILFSIVTRLRRELDAIDRGKVRDAFFGGQFVMTLRDGKQLSNCFFTPFRAEIFGTPSELESLKKGKLKDICEVRLKYAVEGQ